MAASSRPWLLIDVDGVLNPLIVAEGFDLHVLAPSNWAGPPLQVQLTQRHGEWINELTDLFDLVWATTWEDSANTVIAPLVGLPGDLPVVSFSQDIPRTDWEISFKSPAVAAYVGGHPFAWLDDSITEADTRWFTGVPGIGPFHLQAIDPRLGLTRDDCAAVRRWAEGL